MRKRSGSLKEQSWIGRDYWRCTKGWRQRRPEPATACFDWETMSQRGNHRCRSLIGRPWASRRPVPATPLFDWKTLGQRGVLAMFSCRLISGECTTRAVTLVQVSRLEPGIFMSPTWVSNVRKIRWGCLKRQFLKTAAKHDFIQRRNATMIPNDCVPS